jgi:DNA-directed RNA polymerase specialized sigma24 family protein
LITECDQGDAGAWEELWETLESVVTRAVERFARRRGMDPSIAEDIRQEDFLFLREDPASHLGAFRGGTWEQFHAFISVSVRRFAQNSVRGRNRSVPIESIGGERIDDAGPEEIEVRMLVLEIVSIMSKRDRATLGRLVLEETSLAEDGKSPNPKPPKRLGRREKRLVESLIRRYVPRVL